MRIHVFPELTNNVIAATSGSIDWMWLFHFVIQRAETLCSLLWSCIFDENGLSEHQSIKDAVYKAPIIWYVADFLQSADLIFQNE